VEAAARSVGLSRRRLRGRIGDGPSTAEQLPLTADLLASCLSAGAVPSQAAEAVARSVGGPMAGLLGAAAAELRLGADPGACWARFGRRHPALALLGRCLERAGASGVAPAEAVAALATEQRAAVARAALARSRRAGVIATAPLGLCFLPAFLLIGVAPVVIGLATRLLARI
jgi:pilus assembly protein TadC